MLFLLFSSGELHDYIEYVNTWQHIQGGGNPWQAEGIATNAYGPLHSILGVATAAGALMPKLLFGLGFLAVSATFLVLILRSQPKVKVLLAYTVLVPLNYLVIGLVFVFGNNDGLVAALIGFAVLARIRGHLTTAGLLLGMAILFKYYPALLLPFLALDVRRIKWTVVIASSVTVFLGVFVTYVAWGGSFLSALLFGAGRGATILSVLAHLAHLGAPDSFMLPALRYNSIVVAAVVGGLFLLAWWRRFGWLESMTLGMLAVVTTYKVGHPQFLIPWIVLLVGLLYVRTGVQWRIVTLSIPLVVLISTYQVIFERYWLAGVFWEDTASIIRDQVGIPFFMVSGATVLLGVRVMWRGESLGTVARESDLSRR